MLSLHGYLTLDYDGMIALQEDRCSSWKPTTSIQRAIKDYYGAIHLDKGLGQDLTTIPECSIRIYYTDEECTLDEAEELVADVFNGGLLSNIALVGYSEYTITGYTCEDFQIGGHDLNMELKDHLGQYCHFIVVTGGLQ